MRKMATLAAVMLLCAGCASTNDLSAPKTASGHPEITIKNANAAEVKAKFANTFINDGFSIISSNDMGVELDQQSSNIALDVLTSCRYCARPRSRINVSVIQIGKDVRVIVSPYWIVNPGAPSERRIQIEEGGAVDYVRRKLAAATN